MVDCLHSKCIIENFHSVKEKGKPPTFDIHTSSNMYYIVLHIPERETQKNHVIRIQGPFSNSAFTI